MRPRLLPPFVLAFLPIFISSCVFGGIAKSRAAIRFASVKSSEDSLALPTIHFAFFNGPIDEPGEAYPAFAVYGRAAAAWARLEHHLDAVIIHINKEAFSARLYEKEHPISFERKIDLLKKWFNQHPPLASFTGDMRILTSRLKVVAKLDRNVLLHSILSSYDAAVVHSRLD